MRSGFFLKTCASLTSSIKEKRKGAVLIMTILLFFVFGTLALSMIFLSQVYLKIGGYKKQSVLLEYSSENGVKTGFFYLIEAVRRSPGLSVITEEKFAEFKAAAGLSGAAIIEESLGINFPIEIQEEAGQMGWKSQVNYMLEKISAGEAFFAAQFDLPIRSEGRLKNQRPFRTSWLDTKVEVMVGHIPLPFVSFLLNKDLDAEQKENFLEQNNIIISAPPGQALPQTVSFSEEPLIPQEATPLLEKAMNIKILRPQDLTNARLRSVLGLEESEEPVPEGVYLIRNDLGLGGIYIQGDVEEMVLAIADDFQVISFRLESGVWILKFSPSQSRTRFITPQGEEVFDLVPLGFIIVRGQIRSLGGGAVGPEGNVSLMKEEIPSILQGVSLTLVASDRITITSHLLQQGLQWQEGIPYLKSEAAQLVIFTTGQDFTSGETRDGGIVIDPGASAEIKVQATLTAGGGGFKIEGEQKSVHVLGSLQTTDYSSEGNQLRLTPLPPPAHPLNPDLAAPQTTLPVLFLHRFEAAEWREF
jgi:hypothetical protein